MKNIKQLQENMTREVRDLSQWYVYPRESFHISTFIHKVIPVKWLLDHYRF